MRHNDPVGIAFVALAAVGFGILAPLARVAGDLGFTAVTLSLWRSIVSVAALAIILGIGIAMRRAETTPWSAITRVERLQLMAMGVFVAGTTLGLFSAYERITIALTLIVFYTYPMMVALAASRMLGEPLGPRRIFAIVLASAGMVLVVVAPGEGETVGIEVFGVLFAFVAALCQTGYALVAARGFASVPAFQASTILRGFSLSIYLVALVPFLIVVGEFERFLSPLASPEAWVVVFVVGVFGAALPTVALLAGYRRVGPTRGAVLMLLEPVVGVAIAAVWLAERPAPLQLAGGLMVLAGAALVQLAPVRRVEVSAAPLGE